MVASTNGKYTSYDCYCYIHDERQSQKSIDLSNHTLSNGWFTKTNLNEVDKYNKARSDYEWRCKHYSGNIFMQDELDKEYNKMKEAYDAIPLDDKSQAKPLLLRYRVGFDDSGSSFEGAMRAVIFS